MIKAKRSIIGDWVVVFLCVIIIIVCLLPLVSVFARSVSSSEALIKNQVTIWPKGFNLNSYKYVLNDSKYTWALIWTAILTAICTCLSLFMNIICAYPLTFKKLKGRRFFSIFMLITMYFNAGLIPTYLLLHNLKWLDKPIVLIVPYCLSVFNVILMRSFFFGIPESLRESAELDGAGPLRILWSIYLPLSTPVIATLALFYAVGRWNGFGDALYFMKTNRTYYPIQLLLYNIIRNLTAIDTTTQEGFSSPGLSEGLKSATVFFATVPILLVYPKLQKYFIAGVTLGAIKE
jgi:putative aldouronate transport system permease protein